MTLICGVKEMRELGTLERLGQPERVTPDEPNKHYLLTHIETVECFLCFHRVVWRKEDVAPALCAACAGLLRLT